MKKMMVSFVVAAAVFAFGCADKKGEEVKSPELKAMSRIVISGSATTTPILKVLSEAYERINPGLTTDFLPSSHTGGGIKGAHSGEIDLGAVSRALEKEEEQLGLTYVEFARDSIAFATNQNIPIKSISADQIRQIYSGRITRWSQLKQPGLKDEDIVVIDRPAHSSPKIVLQQLLFTGDFVFGSGLVMVERALDTNEALTKTPNSLGYTSLAAIFMEKMPLNILGVDGVQPTPDNVTSGRYPYFRPMAVVYRPDVKKEVLDFMAFISSPDGEKIILDNGFAPALNPSR